MTGSVADGFLASCQAIGKGIEPDPDMLVDKWAEANMVLPAGKSAEPGPYRTDRTPFAREIMRRLSPADPCRRVVVMGPSQLLKTQTALNWIGASIHQAPGNILALLPTLPIAKRVSSRVSDVIKLIPALRARVAEPRSRDSRNTMDTKEFIGGTLFITTAASASNLAEIPARYVYGDEIDRWEGNVGGEGDPVELAEARTSTFEYNAKILYTSSPTLEGVSRISNLNEVGDKNQYWVECPHCGEHQVLQWETIVTLESGRQIRAGIHWDDPEQPRRAWYVCPHCGAEIDEQEKARFLPDREMGGTAEWRPQQAGDGQTASFQINALYAPLGFVSWISLVRQYLKAKKKLDQGDPEPMQVFYNTRLAMVWDATVERTRAEELKARAGAYPLGIVPPGGLYLTAAVDTQPNRLEVEVKAWGEGLENWVILHRVMWGDPTQDDVWARLDELLNTPVRNHRGIGLRIATTCIDSGGANTQDVYNYTRHRQHRHILAIKGASKPNRPVMAGKPSKVDVDWRGQVEADGALLWFVGTDTAKDWIHNRLKLTSGPGAAHFSNQLGDEYFEQLTAERKLIRYVKGHARTEWVKKPGDRNEALDLFVYNLAAAYRLGLHAYTTAEWDRARQAVDPVQGDLLMAPPQPAPQEVAESPEAAAPARATTPMQAPIHARRITRSAYLS